MSSIASNLAAASSTAAETSDMVKDGSVNDRACQSHIRARRTAASPIAGATTAMSRVARMKVAYSWIDQHASVRSTSAAKRAPGSASSRLAARSSRRRLVVGSPRSSARSPAAASRCPARRASPRVTSSSGPSANR